MIQSEKQPKALYAIQGTGNGHVARAREIIPILQKYCDLDIALSGDQSQVELPVEPKFRSKGLTFIYNSKGGISYPKTLFKNNLLKILQELWAFPVDDYDLIINDFEFITAWACKLKKKECYGMGHQASFFSRKTPRPLKGDWIGEFILKNYAPCSRPIGFHFDHFDDFIEKPVIRGDIRRAEVKNNGHYTVYLPAYGDEEIYSFLSQIHEKPWQVFSKHVNEVIERGNVIFIPTGNAAFVKSFVSCEGVFTSAGFETPAEAIYLGKKVMVVPIKNQYEQYCNAAAMEKLGVPVLQSIGNKMLPVVRDWVLYHKPLNISYPDNTEKIIVERIIEPYKQGKMSSTLAHN